MRPVVRKGYRRAVRGQFYAVPLPFGLATSDLIHEVRRHRLNLDANLNHHLDQVGAAILERAPELLSERLRRFDAN
jgi:hypothetical protein